LAKTSSANLLAADLAGNAARLLDPSVDDYIALLKPRVMSLVVFTGFVGLYLAPGHLHPLLAAVAVLCIAIGAFISYASTLWFVFIVFHTLFAGKRAAANPWGEGATTLEWAQPSPPPFHTYEELPVIR